MWVRSNMDLNREWNLRNFCWETCFRRCSCKLDKKVWCEEYLAFTLWLWRCYFYKFYRGWCWLNSYSSERYLWYSFQLQGLCRWCSTCRLILIPLWNTYSWLDTTEYYVLQFSKKSIILGSVWVESPINSSSDDRLGLVSELNWWDQ